MYVANQAQKQNKHTQPALAGFNTANEQSEKGAKKLKAKLEKAAGSGSKRRRSDSAV